MASRLTCGILLCPILTCRALRLCMILQPKADYAALCHAAEKGSLPMVQLLLVKGANPYTYDDTGVSLCLLIRAVLRVQRRSR